VAEGLEWGLLLLLALLLLAGELLGCICAAGLVHAGGAYLDSCMENAPSKHPQPVGQFLVCCLSVCRCPAMCCQVWLLPWQ
jgi:hypothetical protein